MDRDTFDQGLTIRKEVLSAEHVERSLAGADDFIGPLSGAGHGILLGRFGVARACRARRAACSTSRC